MAPDHVVFGRRTDAFNELTASSSHALALTFRDQLELVARSSATSQSIRSTDRLPSMGFWYPSTLTEKGSDLHQLCLSWLCYAFRLSQPLDASFRLNPFPPCFMRVAPMGFQPSEVFPSRTRETPHDVPSLHAVPRRIFLAGKPVWSPRRRSSKGLRYRKVRFDKHGVTRRMPTDPLLAFCLSEVFTPLASTPCFHEVFSLGLSRLAERQAAHLDVGSAEFQRTRR